MGGEKEENSVMVLEKNSIHIEEGTSKLGFKQSPFGSLFLQRTLWNEYATTEQEKEGVQTFPKLCLMY